MRDETDEIRARVNIVDLVGSSVNLKKAGKDWKGLCPFHQDRNPSFQVSPQLGRYRCWSCGEHGDIFTWVMKTQNVEFREALEILAKQAGVTLKSKKPSGPDTKPMQLSAMEAALQFFRDALIKSPAARAYCERRGISDDVIARWEIGYAPDVGEALANHLKRGGFSLNECKALFLVDQDAGGGFFDKFRGRLMFPIRDERGELVAFGGRLLGDGHPKYINSSDTPLYKKSRVLYGMYRAKDAMRETRTAVMVEGYLDVIACHSAGVTNAVASLGTALSEEHAKLLARWCDGVTILYDSDAAGEKAAGRGIEVLEAEKLRIRVALMPAGEDPDTLLRTAGAAAVQDAVKKGVKPLDYRIRSIEKRLKSDQEEFWNEIAAALATEPLEMERSKHILRLAPTYPDLRDPIEAQKALRRMVTQAARAHKSPEPANLRASASPKAKASPV
ncbi:MAG TPA: DNA primase, partial [Fimbriimonadaceae bacterium]|nr:DNA primase [Fimbriimonadaceae bacterium]